MLRAKSRPLLARGRTSGKTRFGQRCSRLGSRLDGGKAAQEQYDAADNMTQQLSALACLLQENVGETALAKFYEQWKHDRLVMDKWFGLQVSCARPPKTRRATAEALTQPRGFRSHKNPNRFRATLGAPATRCATRASTTSPGGGYTLAGRIG